MNRIGCSRLYDLSRILDVPVGFFFDDMPEDVAAKSPAQTRGKRAKATNVGVDPLAKRESLEFVRAYYKISDPIVRKRLFNMVKSLAMSEQQ